MIETNPSDLYQILATQNNEGGQTKENFEKYTETEEGEKENGENKQKEESEGKIDENEKGNQKYWENGKVRLTGDERKDESMKYDTLTNDFQINMQEGEKGEEDEKKTQVRKKN